MTIDVIIPILNDASIFVKRREYFEWLKSKANLVFVDGGSEDHSPMLAKAFGHVAHSSRGKALQKNTGAARSRAEVLMFLNPEAVVTEEAWDDMEQALAAGCDAGCFSLSIEEKGLVHRVLEWMINVRARHFLVMDGDLGLFVKRILFQEWGHFDEVPAMEDILFARKLQQARKVAVLQSVIFLSGRKWQQQGFLRTLLQYAKAYLQLWTGLPFFKEPFKPQEVRI